MKVQKQMIWLCFLLGLATVYVPPSSADGGTCGGFGCLTSVKDYGTRVTATVANVPGNEVCRDGSNGSCYPQAYIVTYDGDTHGTRVDGGGLPSCHGGEITTRQCWEGATVEFWVQDNRMITDITVSANADWGMAGIELLGVMPSRPHTCATEHTALTLAAMHPGEDSLWMTSDVLRVRCNMATDLRLSLLTPTITYAPGAVSTITVPKKVRVDGDVTTGIPITIKTRVDPSDVVAGSYTQSIVLKIEHD